MERTCMGPVAGVLLAYSLDCPGLATRHLGTATLKKLRDNDDGARARCLERTKYVLKSLEQPTSP
jgi:hypothetical protein